MSLPGSESDGKTKKVSYVDRTNMMKSPLLYNVLSPSFYGSTSMFSSLMTSIKSSPHMMPIKKEVQSPLVGRPGLLDDRLNKLGITYRFFPLHRDSFILEELRLPKSLSSLT